MSFWNESGSEPNFLPSFAPLDGVRFGRWGRAGQEKRGIGRAARKSQERVSFSQARLTHSIESISQANTTHGQRRLTMERR